MSLELVSQSDPLEAGAWPEGGGELHLRGANDRTPPHLLRPWTIPAQASGSAWALGPTLRLPHQVIAPPSKAMPERRAVGEQSFPSSVALELRRRHPQWARGAPPAARRRPATIGPLSSLAVGQPERLGTASVPTRRRATDRVFVGFSTTSIFLSDLIRRISDADYSHAWLCHGHELWGGAWITEAEYPTVRALPYEVATAHWSKLMVFEAAPSFFVYLEKAMRENRRLFGKRFDVGGLFGMGMITLLQKWLPQRWNNLLGHTDQVFCSEFVACVLKATGADPFKGWVPKQSSPKEVYLTCDSHEEIFRRVEPSEFVQWLTEVGVPSRQLRPEIVSGSLDWAAAHPAAVGRPQESS